MKTMIFVRYARISILEVSCFSHLEMVVTERDAQGNEEMLK